VRRAPLLLLLVAAATGGQGQTPAAPVRIEAVVTDAQGRPLLDLRPSDFALKSGDAALAINDVVLRRADDIAAGRTLALFLDEFHVGPGEPSERVRQTLLRFVDEQLRPSDRVIVMKPLDSQTAIRFSDRAAVRSAIESFSGRRDDYAPRSAFEEEFFGRAPAAVQTARAQVVTSAVRALTVRLGELASGRSAIAFVSEGFAAVARERERRLPDFQGIARAATRFDVAIYSIDPSTAIERSDRGTVPARLMTLASDTGGESAFGDQLAPALSRMTRDLDAYYVVSFAPQASPEGRFQRLELTARRKGAVVRAPAGYWTPYSSALATASRPATPARELHRSPMIDAWTGLTRLADGRMRLRLTWQPTRILRSSPVVPVAVSLRAAAPGGKLLFEGRVAPVSAVRAADAPQLVEFIVPPGRIELDMSILSRDGSTLDRDARDIDVPDARASRSAVLVPELVQARSNREFLAAKLDPEAPPTPLREFRRADRLLVRAPAIGADGSRLAVTARLLNRWGQPMRELALLPAFEAVVQFDLPLSWLAAGEYEIEVTSNGAGGRVAQRLTLKVTG
jgi:VWFA-related protein